MAKLTWLGQRIVDRMERAEKAAIDDVMGDCAKEASGSWPRESGLSARNIRIRRHARRRRDEVYGLWGGAPLAKSAKYTSSSRWRIWFVEIGVRGRRGLGLLRRTADRRYPSLRGRIAYHFARGR